MPGIEGIGTDASSVHHNASWVKDAHNSFVSNHNVYLPLPGITNF